MAECEVCGKESANKRAEIDGVILEVCDNCVKLGKEVAPPRPIFIRQAVAKTPKPESIESERELASDFSTRIRKAREQRNLTQDEAAMKMGISHLIYKRIEGGFKPDDSTAKRLERFYSIELYAKN